MTFNEFLLQKLASWRPAEKTRSLLLIPDEGAGWTATLTANRNDELGCLVWELALRRTASSANDVEALKNWAERCAAHVTALLEPLKVLEVDGTRNEAQLRSDPPSARGEAVFYYEVLLKGTTEAVLRRFEAFHETGTPRGQVLFPLTHEALAKAAAQMTRD